MPGYIPRALGDEAHLHGNSAGAQEHAFVPQQHGFPPGFHRPMAQPAPQRHGTFGAQPHIMPNSPVSGFSYVPYQPAQPDQRYDVLLQRIAGLENAVGQLQATCSQLSARDAALLQRVGGMVAMECASQMASLEEKVDEMGSDIAEVSSKRTAALSRPPSRKSAHSYSPKPSSSPSVIDYSEEGEDDASSMGSGSVASRGSRATLSAAAKKLPQFSTKDVDRLKTKLDPSGAENWIADFIESVEDVSDDAAAILRLDLETFERRLARGDIDSTLDRWCARQALNCFDGTSMHVQSLQGSLRGDAQRARRLDSTCSARFASSVSARASRRVARWSSSMRQFSSRLETARRRRWSTLSDCARDSRLSRSTAPSR